jgi:hypothetical protein
MEGRKYGPAGRHFDDPVHLIRSLMPGPSSLKAYVTSIHPRRLLLILLWVVLSIGYGVAFYELIQRIIRSAARLQYMFGGMAAYGGVWFLFLRHRARFWWTFEHELTHVIFALLFGHEIRHFRASPDKGGSIHHRGRSNNFLIALAPHFFPTLSVVPLLLLFIVVPWAVPYVEFAVGVTVLYHVISTFYEARPHQPDLKGPGLLFSYTFIVLMNLVCLGTVLAMTGFGAEAGWNFLVRGLEVLYPAV